jgi:hypothetical protein
MATEVRIEMNRAGIQAILKAPDVQDDLLRRAKLIANAANTMGSGDSGEDFVASGYFGRNRARASVITATQTGKRDESEDKILTRAIDAGRA